MTRNNTCAIGKKSRISNYTGINNIKYAFLRYAIKVTIKYSLRFCNRDLPTPIPMYHPFEKILSIPFSVAINCDLHQVLHILYCVSYLSLPLTSFCHRRTPSRIFKPSVSTIVTGEKAFRSS